MRGVTQPPAFFVVPERPSSYENRRVAQHPLTCMDEGTHKGEQKASAAARNSSPSVSVTEEPAASVSERLPRFRTACAGRWRARFGTLKQCTR